MNINKETLKIYWEQVRKYKTSFFFALITIPVAGLLLNTLVPLFFSTAIGGITKGNESSVIHNLILATILGVAGVGLNFLGYQVIVRHESNVRKSLSNAVFRRILSKDLSFFVNEKVGALTGHYIDFLRDQMVLQDLIINQTLGFILAIGTGIVIVAFHSLLLAGILLALMVGLLFQVRHTLHIRAPYRKARKDLASETNGKVADAVTNNLIVKTFAREKFEADKLDIVNEKFRKAWIADLSITSIEGSSRIFVMTIVQIIAVGVSAYLVFNHGLSLAIAIFTLTYLQRVSTQLFSLGEMVNGYDQALLEAAPMTETLLKPEHVLDAKDATLLQAIDQSIIFDHASYRYSDDGAEVLKDISFTIKPGQKVGLVGPSGAGKTTITHLLLRFSDVTGGSIMIGDQDLRTVTQESLRENIAYVPQEPMLFHRSLRDNITYGRLNATDEEIEAAVKSANAAEFIDALPKGLETLVGERGVKLSGGQRQRIAIARAILKDAPILVLDEATSALDSESEKLIQTALEKLMKGRTSLVIAHRLSTIAKLDRIIVLDNGHVAEDGTHEELLVQKGIYARLWAHQSGGFIEE